MSRKSPKGRQGMRTYGTIDGRANDLEMLERRLLLSRATHAVVASAAPAEVEPPYQLPQYRLLNQRGSHFLTKPAAGKPLDIALKFLRDNAPKLGFRPEDVGTPIVTDQYTDADTGVTHIYLRQQYNGLEIANANLSVHVTRDGRVLTVGGGFVPKLSRQMKASAALNGVLPNLAADQALTDAASGLGLKLKSKPVLKSAPRGKSLRRDSVLQAKDVSLDDVPARLHYVATAQGLKLAWDLVVRTPDHQHWYNVSVDGVSGGVVAAVDWVEHATYNVLPLPTESPADGPRQLLTDPYDPVSSPFGWQDTNGVAGAEFTDTRGNNVSAQDDIDANNTGGTRADGGAGLNFDFPLDLTQAPSTYRPAAITNLFYVNNLLHDIHARYGFTEAAGNFQVMNYSGQGLGNDAVQADAQDGSGTNNANFATPPDGSAPRMQMYVFNYTSPNRDADLDNLIITHEYGHGVTNRLTGGPANSNALTAVQSGSMGEGWGDWWGLMLTQKPTDGKNDAYPVGTYSLGQASTGAGFRRYPYSFDKTKDPLTYGNFKTNSEVHAGGEIWCAALWDLNWLLIDKYGFSADVAHGYNAATPGRNAGNNLALKLVMDALKLQPANPSMLAARDAILAADQALTGGNNAYQIWTAFARRGMGFSAKDGGSASSTNVTEAFDIPPGLNKPMVASILPSTIQTTPVSQLDVNFSKAMNPASFALADDVTSFLAPDGTDLLGQITATTWVNTSTLRITFNAQSQDGQYTLVLGPNITSADDNSPMDQDQDGTAGEATQDQYAAKFRYDSVLMAVSSTSPANNAVVTLPFTTLDVNFNEPVGASSIGTGDLTLSRGSVTGAVALDADTVRYTLSGITGEINLTFTLPAGALTDPYGNPSAAYSGSFAVDNGTTPFPTALTTNWFAGSGIRSGTASANLSFAGDADSFTVNIDAGQTITALVDPATTLQAKIELFDPQGNLLGASSGAAAGKDAFLQSVPAAAAGQYKVTVTGLGTTTGTARVELTLGAVIEAEAHDGAGNSPEASAQSIASAFTPLGAQAGQDRAAVVGTVASISDLDWYAFPLSAGDTISAVANGAVVLTIAQAASPATRTYATSTPYGGTNGVSAMISDFVAPADGTYYLRVAATTTANYAVQVTRNAGFEIDPTGATSPAQATYARAVNGQITYAGYLAANDVDTYRFAVKAGVPFTVRTATPGDGPYEPSNPLDPKVQVLAGTQVLAADDNSAPDGHNAIATYTPTADGIVWVTVSQSSAALTGEYTLSVDGGQATGDPFTGTVVTPANNAKVGTAITTVTVDFSDAYNMDTVAASDLTLDGVPATGFTMADANTILFTVPANTTPGAHTIAIAAGAITDIHGNLVLGISSTYTLDNVGPRIINTTVQENDVRAPGSTTFTFTFDEPINPTVIDYSDFTLYGQYKNLYYSPGYAVGAGNTSITLSYSNLPEDHYTLTLLSGINAIVDTSGNGLDGEAVAFPIPPNKTGNGTPGGSFVVHFDVDGATAAFPTLALLNPAGASVYDASTTGVIGTAGDADSFTIALDAGQTLTAILDPATTLQATVSLFDPQGNLVLTATPTATGKDAVLQGLPITAAGTYTVTVTGQSTTTGTYRLELATSAVAEAEAHDGATDDTIATAQSLNAALTKVPGAAAGDRAAVLGVLSSSADTDYYSISLAAGDTLALATGIQTGATPLLALYDPAGTLVAYSGIPSGGSYGLLPDYVAKTAGTYAIRVTATSSSTYQFLAARNAGFDTEPNTTIAQAANLQARPAATGERTVVGYTSTTDFDYYRLPVTAGTPVTLKTFTPADGPNQPVSLPNPRLRILNFAGTVLATDDNSAPDGRNALLTYTPAADDTLYVEVVSVSGSGDYTLSVSGAAAATPPFTATVLSPVNNAKLATPPTAIVVDFNDSIDLSTLVASDLTVDGVPAPTMTVVDYNTVNFNLPAALAQGQHTLAIAAGAVADVQGTPLAAMTSTFTLDNVAPRVIGSSVQENEVRPLAATTTFTVTFDEPMLVTNLDATDFTLRGANNALNYTATAFSYNAAGTVLTLTYANLPEDRYTLTLLSATGRFEDAIGNDLDGEPVFPMPPGKSGNGTAGGNFVVNFDVDNTATAPLPTPMAPPAPAGALAYQSTASGLLNSAADTDTLTLNLDDGQTLTLLLAPTPFKSTLAVYDPAGTLVATTTAPTPGKALLLQNLPITTAGTYRFVISSADTTAGAYTLTATLNAAREQENYGGPANDSLATAQDLGPALNPVAPGVSVATVLGATDTGFTNAFLVDAESGAAGFTFDNTIGGLWHLSTGRGSQAGHSTTHSFYYGKNETDAGGGTYDTGVRNAGYLTSPSITLPNSSQITLGFNYVLKTEGSTSWDKSIVQVSTDGGTSWIQLASYNGTAESTTWKAATPINLAAYAGQTVKFRWSFDTLDSGANAYEGWYVDDIAVQTPSSTTGDFYAVNLAAGDRVSLVANTVTPANLTLALLDPSGATLATGTSGPAGTSAAIDQFLATATGTYYVKVTGTTSANYALSLTRNAAIAREPNNTPATAQDITPTGAVIGNLAGGPLAPLVSENFESGTLGPAWSTYSSGPSGRIQVTGQYTTAGGNFALLMDTSTIAAVLNEAIYTVNLSGQSKATLTFSHNDYNDEETPFATGDFTGHQNADGIAVSADGGVTWRPIWSAPSTQANVWTTYTLDLAQLAGTLPLGPNFKIKFQQYDDNPLTTDGRGWDNVSVNTPTPAEDYYSLDLTPGTSLTIATATPGDGPYEFTNNLNPRLELFDPQGNLVASDDNGAADGKNALLTYTAPAAGRYIIKVSAASAAPGDYVLTTSTKATDNPPPDRPDLVATSDTGVSATDNLTRLDNRDADHALTFSIGGTTAGATITLYADGVAIGSAVATDTTTLITTDGIQALDDGLHVFTARQTAAGKPESISSSALFVTVDASAPLAPLVPKLQAASDTGTVGDNTTADSTPTFDVGGIPAGYYFRFYRDGKLIGGDYDAGATFTPATAQPDGTYAYTVTVVDPAGNESVASLPVTVTIQTQGPSTPAGALDLRSTSDSGASATDNITNDNTPTFNLPAAVYAFRVYRNGVRISGLFETGSSYTAPAQADGTADYTFTAVDASGNESAPSPALSVTIDTAAPTAPAAPDLQAASDTGTSSTDNLTSDNTPTFDLPTLPAGHFFRFYRNGVLVSGTYQTGTTYTTAPLPDGSADYTVRVVDAAGNESAPGAALTVTVDTVAPAAVAPDLQAASDSGSSNTDNVTNDTTPTIDLVGAFAYRLFRDGVEVTPPAGGSGSFTEAAPLADGTYAYTAIVLDQAGNASPVSTALSVTIDTTAPASPAALDLQAASDTGASDIDNVTRDNTPTFDLPTLPAGHFFRLYRNGVPLPGDLSAATYTSPALADGSYTFALAAVDPAGNVSAPGAALSVLVDTTAPSAGNTPFGPDATFDPSGSTPGYVTASVGIPDRGAAVATLPDGSILLGGSATIGATGRDAYVVYRRLPSGQLDPAFGTGGVAISPTFGPAPNYRARAQQMVVLADGKILVIGDAERASDVTYSLGLARFNADGTPDATFGTGGITTLTFGGKGFYPRASLLLPDGKVLLGGEIQSSTTFTDRDLALVRLGADGQPDPTFGTAGIAVKSLAASFDMASGLALLPGGKILAAATASLPTTGEHFAAVRFNPDGTVDTSYGTDGVAMAIEPGVNPIAFGGVLQPDGKFVVAGSGYAGSVAQFRATRFNPDGTLDTTFGLNGFAATTMPASAAPLAQDVLLLPGGKILVAGQLSSDHQDVALARFNADGTVDTSFSPTGALTWHFGLSIGLNQARDVALLPDGKVLLAGEVQVPGFGDYDFLLARFDPGAPAYVPHLQPASDTGPSATDSVTADNTPTFDVTHAPNTFVRVYRNGTLISDPYATGDTFTAPPQPDGTWVYTLTSVDQAGNESQAAATLSVTIDTTAPTVTAADFDGGPGRSIRVTFNEDVAASLNAAALTLTNLTTGAVVASKDVAVAWDPQTRTATFTFPGLPGGTLPDGNYRVTLAAGAVADTAANALAAEYTFDFFVLTGDLNHDRAVNFDDLLILSKNYNTTTGATFGQGDLNGDGAVNFDDLLILSKAYNKTLPAPAPATMATTEPAAAPVTAASVLADDARDKPVFSTTRVGKPAAAPKPAVAKTKAGTPTTR